MVTKAAGIVIFRKIALDVEYLLLQASYSDFHWSPPKGHVDPGENLKQTALREVEEESGLKASDLNIMPNFEKLVKYEVKGKPKEVTYWLAELINPEAKIKLSSEHIAYKWLQLSEACAVAKYESTKELLLQCSDYINNKTPYPSTL